MYSPHLVLTKVLHLHLSLNRGGRWVTTGDFTTSFLHFSLFCTALWDLANCGLVHSLMLSSHLSLCLPCLLPPPNVLCKVALATYDFSLRLIMIVRSSCGPIVCWILARTSSLVTYLCKRSVVSCGSTSFPWLVFFVEALVH